MCACMCVVHDVLLIRILNINFQALFMTYIRTLLLFMF